MAVVQQFLFCTQGNSSGFCFPFLFLSTCFSHQEICVLFSRRNYFVPRNVAPMSSCTRCGSSGCFSQSARTSCRAGRFVLDHLPHGRFPPFNLPFNLSISPCTRQVLAKRPRRWTALASGVYSRDIVRLGQKQWGPMEPRPLLDTRPGVPRSSDPRNWEE